MSGSLERHPSLERLAAISRVARCLARTVRETDFVGHGVSLGGALDVHARAEILVAVLLLEETLNPDRVPFEQDRTQTFAPVIGCASASSRGAMCWGCLSTSARNVFPCRLTSLWAVSAGAFASRPGRT